MNKKTKIKVYIIIIFLILISLIGITYAYYITKISGNSNTKSIEVSTADLKLVYDDGNGIIQSDNIIPGTVITSKTFTVKNTGNVRIDNYSIYLEDVINEFHNTDDLIYSLTCTSSDNTSCNSVKDISYPTTNDLLVNNSIGVNVTHTYSLTITYKETGTDQSIDMNSHFGGKINVYNSKDIVDIEGIVTGTNPGDYLEIHSNPKKSKIDNNNKYKFTGITPGTHTIYLMSKNNEIKFSKEIEILKHSENNNDNTFNININDYSQSINMNINTSSTEMTLNINNINNYDSEKEGTLVNAILTNSINNKNGTIFKEIPDKTVGENTSETYSGTYKESASIEKMNITSTYKDYYITYGEGFTISSNGNMILTNAKVCKYSECYGSLTNKYLATNTISYIFSNSNQYSWRNNSYLPYILKITSTTLSNIDYIKIYKDSVGEENILGKSSDDYGDSYYFRGNIKDNYVSFANKCWRIVRIEGDGSVKLILASNSGICSETNLTDDSSFITYNVYGYDTIEKNGNNVKITNYFSTNSMKNKIESWYINNVKKYDNKIKKDNWCIGNGKSNMDRVYSKKNPSFKCANLASYENDVGAITADEVAYAGGTYFFTNTTYYLHDNTNNIWFTLSPSWSTDTILLVQKEGTLNGNGWSFGEYGIRPVITILSGTTILKGEGTIENPYVID